MRLWSLHPHYLDDKGLTALWREALLAQKVLQGKTKGYTSHPQLLRFREMPQPVQAISAYLWSVYRQAKERGFRFDATKIACEEKKSLIMKVTSSQLNYEWEHLLKKLKERDRKLYNKLKSMQSIQCHPLFQVVRGDIEPWEVI